MLKVSVDNITKLSEDALYLALDQFKESDPMYSLIDAELDRRAELRDRALAKKHRDQLESLKLTQAIQSEISSIFAGYKGKKTLFLIENLGQEFIDNYTICEITFTVTSLVAQNSYSEVPSSWEFDTIEKARAKKAKLIYDRIYDKFMRDATLDNLELLKRLLGGSNVTVLAHYRNSKR